MAALSLVVPFVSRDSFAPLLLGGAFGALLPDLDSPRSLLTAWRIAGVSPLRPVAHVINRTFGHRGALHSLLGWAFASSAFLALDALPFWSIASSVALSLGYFSHLVADASTKTGVPFLYPRRNRYRLLPKRLRLSTGSFAEEVVFTYLLLLFLGKLIVMLLFSRTTKAASRTR